MASSIRRSSPRSTSATVITDCRKRGFTLLQLTTPLWLARRLGLAAVVLFALLLTGCSSIPFFGKDKEPSDEEVEEIDTTEARVYRAAQRALRSSNYAVAIEQLELLEARFPFGRFAEQAQLELIFAHYQTQDMESARAGADRFIRLHPTHPSVDYAYYLKALAAYRYREGFLDRIFSADPASRDMAPVRESYSELALLLREFPNSQYAPDARQRMLLLRDLLAKSEIFAAEHYLRRGALVAAANRGAYVIENYPDTAARADALAVMVEAYFKLGRLDEANRALRVLALNHPDFPEFNSAGDLVLEERIRNRDRSWTNIMTLGLLDRPDTPPPITINYPDAAGAERPGQSEQDGAQEEAEEAAAEKRSIFGFLPFID